MSNKEVINMLSALEEFFYYKRRHPGELEAFQQILYQMHTEAKTLLVQWHNVTGETID